MPFRLSNARIIADATTRILAMQQYVKNNKTEIPIGGKLLKPPAVIDVYQKAIDTRGTVKTKRSELNAALVARDAAEEERALTDEGMKSWVLNYFGADSTEAHEFGYAPKKVTEKTVETKQQAIVRNKATREARHTMGPKAKSKIKGTTVILNASAAPTTTAAAAATTEAPVAAVGAAPVQAQPQGAVPAAATTSSTGGTGGH